MPGKSISSRQIYERLSATIIPLFILTLSCSHRNNEIIPKSLPTETELTLKVDTLLANSFQPNSDGCVVLLRIGNRTIYKKAFGQSNVELNVPMNTENIFKIGSLGKQFTTMAILQIAENKRIALSDDIRKYIPSYPFHGYTITIENLLTHTSGIRNLTDMPKWDRNLRSRDLTPNELMDLFKNEPLEFAPGTEWQYSNSGYILLGIIIERVTGEPFSNYVKKHFLQPLGMRSTYFDDNKILIKNKASGYEYDSLIKNAEYISMTQPYSAGAISTTVEDMLKWHCAIYSYKLVSKTLTDKATNSFRLKNGKTTNYGYGGFAIGDYQGDKIIMHSGGINGFSAFETFCPSKSLYLLILGNSRNRSLELISNIIVSLSLGSNIDFSEQDVAKSLKSNYEGSYEFIDDTIHKISIYADGEKLMFYDKISKRPWQMHFKDDSTFFCYEVFFNSHQFLKYSEGKIIGINIKTAHFRVFARRHLP